jgi:protein tyrosine phosphatase (PTP) superfamily phosphohydrolase (DUF442 family)
MRVIAKNVFVVAVILMAAACTRSPIGSQATIPERVNVEHLPNAYRVHAKVISGGQPDGDAGFRNLQALGVKTIISVDGAKPDVESARRYGLRYVHMPHGYDGIADSRVSELARAVRDLPGPIYIHCHHGKHRSPTAAAVACVASGLIPPDAALPILRTAGTSEDYRGLYLTASKAKRISERDLDAVKADFRESVQLPPMADSMVSIERSFDRLKLIAKAGWQSPKNHPDLDPVHEALILREHYAELRRAHVVQRHSSDFQNLVRDSHGEAEELERAIRLRTPDARASETNELDTRFARVAKLCSTCHQRHRDIPLQDKPAD